MARQRSLGKIIVNILKDESAQGATEYILVLVVVVGLALIFRDKITSIVKIKMEEIANAMQNFKPESS